MKKRQIVNIVNFIRETEPRSPINLLETVQEEINLMKQYNLRGTFMLEYDALLDPVYVDLMKSLDPQQFKFFCDLPVEMSTAGDDYAKRGGDLFTQLVQLFEVERQVEFFAQLGGLDQLAQVVCLPIFLRSQPELVVNGLYHKGNGIHGVRLGQLQITHGGFQIAVDVQMESVQQAYQNGYVKAVGMIKGK